MDFVESEEQLVLRSNVARIAGSYGHEYYVEKARAGKKTDELWHELAKIGFLGVNVPEAYGGGGMGISELAIVVRGGRRRRLPLCSCCRLPGDLRDAHRRVRDRGPAASAGCPRSPTAR